MAKDSIDRLQWGEHSFPLGKITIALEGENIVFLGVNCGKKGLQKHFPKAALVKQEEATAKVAKAFNKLWPNRLNELPFNIELRGTEFQCDVWHELLKIKCGKTMTYSDVAKKIGKPKAVRAVGTAVGKNPVSILVPCHRVINKSSNRVSYGWGADVKLKLLKAEGAL